MKKILIADDNKEFCNTLSDILSEKGYDIHVAHDGKETLKRLYTVSPDLMILDIRIPEICGHEVCRKVREDKFYSKLPIIVMSGCTPEDVENNKELQANEIMTKPFDMQDFLEKVDSILSE